MKMDKFLKICKYYHGEESPPQNADKNYKL